MTNKFVDGQERIKNLEAQEAKRQSLLVIEQKNLEKDWEANQDQENWI